MRSRLVEHLRAAGPSDGEAPYRAMGLGYGVTCGGPYHETVISDHVVITARPELDYEPPGVLTTGREYVSVPLTRGGPPVRRFDVPAPASPTPGRAAAVHVRDNRSVARAAGPTRFGGDKRPASALASWGGRRGEDRALHGRRTRHGYS